MALAVTASQSFGLRGRGGRIYSLCLYLRKADFEGHIETARMFAASQCRSFYVILMCEPWKHSTLSVTKIWLSDIRFQSGVFLLKL